MAQHVWPNVLPPTNTAPPYSRGQEVTYVLVNPAANQMPPVSGPPPGFAPPMALPASMPPPGPYPGPHAMPPQQSFIPGAALNLGFFQPPPNFLAPPPTSMPPFSMFPGMVPFSQPGPSHVMHPPPTSMGQLPMMPNMSMPPPFQPQSFPAPLASPVSVAIPTPQLQPKPEPQSLSPPPHTSTTDTSGSSIPVLVESSSLAREYSPIPDVKLELTSDTDPTVKSEPDEETTCFATVDSLPPLSQDGTAEGHDESTVSSNKATSALKRPSREPDVAESPSEKQRRVEPEPTTPVGPPPLFTGLQLIADGPADRAHESTQCEPPYVRADALEMFRDLFTELTRPQRTAVQWMLDAAHGFVRKTQSASTSKDDWASPVHLSPKLSQMKDALDSYDLANTVRGYVDDATELFEAHVIQPRLIPADADEDVVQQLSEENKNLESEYENLKEDWQARLKQQKEVISRLEEKILGVLSNLEKLAPDVSNSSQTKRLKREVRDLEQKLDDRRAELDKRRTKDVVQIAQYQEKIAKVDKEIEDLRREDDQLQNHKEAERKRHRELKIKVRDTEKKLDTLRREYAKGTTKGLPDFSLRIKQLEKEVKREEEEKSKLESGLKHVESQLKSLRSSTTEKNAKSATIRLQIMNLEQEVLTSSDFCSQVLGILCKIFDNADTLPSLQTESGAHKNEAFRFIALQMQELGRRFAEVSSRHATVQHEYEALSKLVPEIQRTATQKDAQIRQLERQLKFKETEIDSLVDQSSAEIANLEAQVVALAAICAPIPDESQPAS